MNRRIVLQTVFRKQRQNERHEVQAGATGMRPLHPRRPHGRGELMARTTIDQLQHRRLAGMTTDERAEFDVA